MALAPAASLTPVATAAIPSAAIAPASALPAVTPSAAATAATLAAVLATMFVVFFLRRAFARPSRAEVEGRQQILALLG